MAIAPDGQVVPCQSWLGENAGMGNILNVNWKKIWNSSKCKQRRKYAVSSTQKCPLREGGCK